MSSSDEDDDDYNDGKSQEISGLGNNPKNTDTSHPNENVLDDLIAIMHEHKAEFANLQEKMNLEQKARKQSESRVEKMSTHISNMHQKFETLQNKQQKEQNTSQEQQISAEQIELISLIQQLKDTQEKLVVAAQRSDANEQEHKSSSLGLGSENDEIMLLQAQLRMFEKQIKRLQHQLQQEKKKKTISLAGDSDWDGSVESAQKGLREAAARLLGGEHTAQADFDMWDKRIRNHPVHIATQEAEFAEWENNQRRKCAADLKTMRNIVPADIFNITKAELLNKRKMPLNVVTRLWNKRILWFVHMPSDNIARLHYADLVSKYAFQGLDIGK